MDDNAEDALATILEILSLKPGIMHDQHEVFERLLGKLVEVKFPYYLHNFRRKKFQVCKLDQNLFRSYRHQTVRCTNHQAPLRFAPDEGSHDLLFLTIKPDEDTQRMSRLVNRTMTVYDDDCPTCKTPNLIRETNPNLTTTPDYLLVAVMRLINNLIFRTPQSINVSKVYL